MKTIVFAVVAWAPKIWIWLKRAHFVARRIHRFVRVGLIVWDLVEKDTQLATPADVKDLEKDLIGQGTIQAFLNFYQDIKTAEDYAKPLIRK